MKYAAAFISNILLSVFVSIVISRSLLLACSPVWSWSGFDAGLLLEFSKINRKPEFFLVVGRHVTRKVTTVGMAGTALAGCSFLRHTLCSATSFLKHVFAPQQQCPLMSAVFRRREPRFSKAQLLTLDIGFQAQTG